MDALVELLATIPRQPLGTVLHVGAGPFARKHYGALAVNRLVWVDGDPQTVERLRAATGSTAPAEVLHRVVAPRSGPLPWHRFNLGMLDGPLPLSHWAQAFPRAAVTGITEVEAVTLQQLIEDLGIEAQPGELPNVLALDVPGQELELLQATSRAVLRRFQWIALRGTAARGNRAAVDKLLAAAAFTDVGRGAALDPVWPVSLHRFDAVAHTAQQNSQRLAEAQQRIRTLEEELRKATTAADRLQEQLAERETRQQGIDLELLKVESQLALIKDVLRRDLDA